MLRFLRQQDILSMVMCCIFLVLAYLDSVRGNHLWVLFCCAVSASFAVKVGMRLERSVLKPFAHACIEQAGEVSFQIGFRAGHEYAREHPNEDMPKVHIKLFIEEVSHVQPEPGRSSNGQADPDQGVRSRREGDPGANGAGG